MHRSMLQIPIYTALAILTGCNTPKSGEPRVAEEPPVLRVRGLEVQVSQSIRFEVPAVSRLTRAIENGTLQVSGCQCVLPSSLKSLRNGNAVFEYVASPEVGKVSRKVMLLDEVGPVVILDLEANQRQVFELTGIETLNRNEVALLSTSTEHLNTQVSAATSSVRAEPIGSSSRGRFVVRLRGGKIGDVVLLTVENASHSHRIDTSLVLGPEGWKKCEPTRTVILAQDYVPERVDSGLSPAKVGTQGLKVEAFPPGRLSAKVLIDRNGVWILMERVRYGRALTYPMILRMKTNAGKQLGWIRLDLMP